ncbi:MAG: AraC family transcriptional regulator [Victivallaceae bacterium]|nr:AraC family transcriptional regulator [Victivallaceae bacterium]
MDFKANIFFPQRAVRLSAMLLTCGRQLINSCDYRWDGLKRGDKEFCFWQYTFSGRGALRFKDKTYSVNSGEAMLLTVPEDHCYYFPADSDSWEFVFVTMHGREAMRLFRELRRRSGVVAKFDPDSLPVRKAVSICRKSENNEIDSQYTASALAYDFLMSLINYVRPSGQGESRPPEFISRVYDYCLKNIDKAVTVSDMAKCAGYSRYHFTRLFKQFMGESPQYFMSELRIRMAVRLLQTEQLSIKEIAQRCGFGDMSYFCKIFRKFQKVSPNEFRGR